MSASFRRKKRDNVVRPLRNILGRGTKPWTGGITLCSVGTRELDSILGGGQPVGTCLLLEEDRLTKESALSLIKYWCAEAVCHEQLLLMPSFQDESRNELPTVASLHLDENTIMNHRQYSATKKEINNLIDSLPRNLNWDKAAGKKVVMEDFENNHRPLEILEEEDEEEGNEGGDSEEGLKIAWQYRKSVQNERLGHRSKSNNNNNNKPNTFCHSYDLNGRLKDQEMNADYIHILNCANKCLDKSSGFRLFLDMKQKLKEHIDKSDGRLIRLLLYKVPIDAASIFVPLLIAHIRSNKLPVVMFVTVHSWLCECESTLVNLRRCCDVVMQVEGFASRIHYPPPAEFRHLCGLLLLPKVSTVTAAGSTGHFADMTDSKRPASHVYGLKRDRRKLHISLLHIPPEDYAGGGGSVGGAVRSGGGAPRKENSVAKKTGLGCSRQDNDPLAF
eukprot:CAMPEP_0194160218 /NCGR_PEP_ID=MMETSP0152-20130528/78269_1 /TAXON_ID=1049557 /ORGANISM="Thalassiothrix antarctica, Strain L6-D1" /LENGTH=445 /DNA_ID=CAMNT_0038869885 /DNA_START=14 /DNA_END=1351 /DNA_ORIENTATION=+